MTCLEEMLSPASNDMAYLQPCAESGGLGGCVETAGRPPIGGADRPLKPQNRTEQSKVVELYILPVNVQFNNYQACFLYKIEKLSTHFRKLSSEKTRF